MQARVLRDDCVIALVLNHASDFVDRKLDNEDADHAGFQRAG
jgi:hypothetical protein